MKAGTRTIEKQARNPTNGLDWKIPYSARNSAINPDVYGKPELAIEKKTSIEVKRGKISESPL